MTRTLSHAVGGDCRYPVTLRDDIRAAGLNPAARSATLTFDRMTLDRFASFLVGRRALLAGIAITLALLAFVPAFNLELDRSIESLYARNDPRLVQYVE